MRVFDIDIATCSDCGSELKIIARIEDPEVIRKILDHFRVRWGGQPAQTLM
jgi:hypothetical protein